MSQKAYWRRFVERRRRELRDVYPCAVPTHRKVCPRHGTSIPQEAHVNQFDRERREWIRVRFPLTGICKPCRDELYERLSQEYRQLHDAARTAA